MKIILLLILFPFIITAQTVTDSIVNLSLSEIYVLNVEIVAKSELYDCPCGFYKKEKCYNYTVKINDILIRRDTAIYDTAALFLINKIVCIDTLGLTTSQRYILSLSNSDTKDYLLVHRAFDTAKRKYIADPYSYQTGFIRCYKLNIWQRIFRPKLRTRKTYSITLNPPKYRKFD